MKILILSDKFLSNSGGAEKVVFAYASAFEKMGHKVYVITTARKREEVGEEDYEGVKVLRLYSNYHERWRNYLGVYNPWIIGKVEKIIRQIRPDITHAHNLHYYLSFCALKIAKKYSRAVFVTLHDLLAFQYGKYTEFIDQNDLSIPKRFDYRFGAWQQIKRFKKRYNPFRNLLVKHYLGYADKIFAISSALKDVLNQNGIDNVEVIHNGVDVDKWQSNSDRTKEFKTQHGLFGKKVIFFIGRLSVLKGGDNIVRAMKAVTRRIPEAVLLVAGKRDEYAEEMLKLAEKEGVNIVLTGWISGDELKAAYASSDVVVTPSIYFDPFNLINIEAMACKKPVVGTCFGGTPEIVIDNETGHVVNPLNIEMLAQKIIDLLEDPEKMLRFGAYGQQRAKENFSLNEQIKKTLSWYKKYEKRS